MKTILCVSGSSEGTGEAISYIKELNQLQESRLILFHNMEPTVTKAKNGPSHNQLMEELEERNEFIQLLEDLIKDLKQDISTNRIKFEIQIRHGLAQDTIPAVVEREQVDLVVLCDDEQRQLAGKSGNALASDLRSKTHCQVLVVPAQFTSKPERKPYLATA